MKRRDLEKELLKLKWQFKRHGGSHDIWCKNNEIIQIPRHVEVNELLAKSIMKKAKGAK